MNVPFDWTPQTEARLFEIWKAGHSGTAIAQMMGGGLSRSAVIGKLNRMGCTASHPEAPQRTKDMISARGTRTRVAGGGHGGKRVAGGVVKAKIVRQTVKSQLKAGAAIFPIQMNPTSFMDLEPHQCRFPIDDVNAPGTAETMFCGAKKTDDSSYCAHHKARCMAPYKRNRKRLDRSKIIARDRFVFGMAA